MKILQQSICDNHLNAMFFDGVIAEGRKGDKLYTLETYQTGEILYKGDYLYGLQIVELGKQGLINDEDLDDACDNNSDTVEIVVDKFFAIYHNGELVDEDVFISDGDYDEAIEMFEEFLSE